MQHWPLTQNHLVDAGEQSELISQQPPVTPQTSSPPGSENGSVSTRGQVPAPTVGVGAAAGGPS